ncbi:MAG: transposase DNA-binding-containing protein [Isosphaeraceae bacterium]
MNAATDTDAAGTTGLGSTETFGDLNFGAARLGHVARTRRLVRSAGLILRHPGGTLPQKFRDPADLDGFYRLANRKEVTHQAVLRPHRLRTLESMRQAGGPVLVIHDTTELVYTGLTSVAGLGQIGNGSGRGLPLPQRPGRRGRHRRRDRPGRPDPRPPRRRPGGRDAAGAARPADPREPALGPGERGRRARPGGGDVGRRLRPRPRTYANTSIKRAAPAATSSSGPSTTATASPAARRPGCTRWRGAWRRWGARRSTCRRAPAAPPAGPG